MTCIDVFLSPCNHHMCDTNTLFFMQHVDCDATRVRPQTLKPARRLKPVPPSGTAAPP